MFITLRDLKESTHYSQRVGHGLPGVVVCYLWCIVDRFLKREAQIFTLLQQKASCRLPFYVNAMLNLVYRFLRLLSTLVTDSEPVILTGSEKRWSPKYLVARSRLGRFALLVLAFFAVLAEERDERTSVIVGMLKLEFTKLGCHESTRVDKEGL